MKKTHHKAYFIWLFAFLSFSVSTWSCTKPEVITIGIVPQSQWCSEASQSGFWGYIKMGVDSAEAELNSQKNSIPIKIAYAAPASITDWVLEQEDIVDSLRETGIDVLALAPVDEFALLPPVQRTLAMDIPVLIFDSRLAENDSIIPNTYVGTDNYAFGRDCARKIVEMGAQHILLMRFRENSNSTLQREAGFMDFLKDELPSNSNITVRNTNQFSGAILEYAMETTRKALNRFPETDAIFCPSELVSTAAYRTLMQQSSLSRKDMIFLGCDYNQELRTVLPKSRTALYIQDPILIGYQAVMQAYQLAIGTKTSLNTYTPTYLLTEENMHRPSLKRLLELPVVNCDD